MSWLLGCKDSDQELEVRGSFAAAVTCTVFRSFLHKDSSVFFVRYILAVPVAVGTLLSINTLEFNSAINLFLFLVVFALVSPFNV